MKLLRKIRNYYFYCGIEKDEYNDLKKEAYISNFIVWRVLHFLMAAAFGVLVFCSLFNDIMKPNLPYYLGLFVYSIIAIGMFFVLKKDSLAAQLLIYLSISALFLFGALITQNKPDSNATTFIVLLLVTPMFMIDKPFFMTIELCTASIIFTIWMHSVKPHDVWMFDTINVISFTILGIFLNIIANSIRIREFVLTKTINIQKDTDEMTGLKNKAALTREINEFLVNDSNNRGTLFVLDVDHFKSINDNYGHDIGDSVIIQIGRFLAEMFNHGETTGRFGGDEFIIFLKNVDNRDIARMIGYDIVNGVKEHVELPDKDQKVIVSVGIAIYSGIEKNYSGIFKKADIALYEAKADPENRVYIYE